MAYTMGFLHGLLHNKKYVYFVIASSSRLVGYNKDYITHVSYFSVNHSSSVCVCVLCVVCVFVAYVSSI